MTNEKSLERICSQSEKPIYSALRKKKKKSKQQFQWFATISISRRYYIQHSFTGQACLLQPQAENASPHCHLDWVDWVLHFHLSGSSLSCFDECKKIWTLTRGASVRKENTGTVIFKAACSQQIQNILYMGPSDQEKENTLMRTCLHTSEALAQHFCSQHSRFYLVSKKPAPIQKIQWVLCALL